MRILLGTDGSEHANLARDLVASIGWPAASIIRVVTAVEPAEVVLGAPWAGGLLAEMDALEGELVAHGQSVVDETVRGIPQGTWSVETAVLRGGAAHSIVHEARQFGADTIVVGSRGHGAIASMLLGSVAAEVVDHAPCPVLVARQPRLTRVVLAHDGSDYALGAEALLSNWPIFGETAIEVVSVAQQRGPWHLPSSATLYAPSVPDYFASYRSVVEEHTQIAQQASERLRSAGLHAAPVVVEGDPAASLLRVADERQADLILLGTHGRTGLRRMLLGSVARNILQHAPVSVLVVRPVAGQ